MKEVFNFPIQRVKILLTDSYTDHLFGVQCQNHIPRLASLLVFQIV